jgi:hypothetical protein
MVRSASAADVPRQFPRHESFSGVVDIRRNPISTCPRRGCLLILHDREGDWPMNDAMRLDLDLSALPLDDFEVAEQELTVESLTGGQAVTSCEGHCCNHCACPCVCCS